MNINKLMTFNLQHEMQLIRQSETSECGLACVAMLSGFFGCHQSMHQLRSKFGIDKTGTNFERMLEMAAEMGMSGEAYEIAPEDGQTYEQAVVSSLDGIRTPIILHWDADHFVVLKSLRSVRQMNPLKQNFMGKRWVATVYDPGRGIIDYSLSEFVRHFHTGYLLILDTLPTFEKGDHREQISFSNLWSKIRGFKTSIGMILALSVVLQATLMITPYYVQTVLDSVFVTNDKDLLTVLAIGFAGLALFERFAGTVRGISMNIFNNLFNAQLATGLYHHLLRLPQHFFENRSVGEILSRFSSLDQIRGVLVNGLVLAVLDGFMSVMVFTLMMFYSAKLTLIIIGMLSVYLLLQWFFMDKNKEFIEQIIQKDAEIHSQQIETLRSIQTLKLFNAQASREAKWASTMGEYTRMSAAQGNFKEVMTQVALLIKSMMHVIIVYLGATMVIDGQFSAGMFLAFLAYRTMLSDSLSNLITKYAEYKLLDVHFERVSDVVLTEQEDAGELPTSQDPMITGRLTLRNVSFSYGAGSTKRDVLSNVSLDIQRGDSLAITGPSGAGKTTLMKIMLGLLQPTSGEVLVDGKPLQSFGIRKFRNQIATVMQEDQLLSGTILDNIAFFDNEPDREWAMECAKAASVYDDIESMPMTWNTLVGDMGSALSGGQKQRILLARALYRRPQIIFLDEATSHLDKNREAAINHAMAKMSITRIVIAHRQETIDSAERVFHLNKVED